MKCYVFDLDGTLANLTHRLHYIEKPDKDWRGFFAAANSDTPIKPLTTLFRSLIAAGEAVVVVSGRSDECRHDTERWLHHHGLIQHRLYMRREGDHRQDYLVKKDLLTKLLADGYEPILFIDDRKQVVDMWRAEGYTCLQCAEGDF